MLQKSLQTLKKRKKEENVIIGEKIGLMENYHAKL